MTKFGLPELIELIRNDPKIGNGKIRHPRMLLKYLNKLENMIGNQSIKNSVAEQITSLLKQDRLQGTNTNTILYGDPGVGKTTIGVYLAKIWYALGCLQGNGGGDDVTQQNRKKERTGFGTGSGTDTTGVAQIALWVTIIFLLYVILSGVIPPLYNALGLQYFIIVSSFLILTLIIIWAVYYKSNDNNHVNRGTYDTSKRHDAAKKNKVDNEHKVNNKDTTIKKYSISELEDIDEDTVIKIISREDLVEQYVGWTAKKVESLLKANMGKVIFIDEAYSIINSINDPFGVEALNTLNKFIGENKGRITVIMAGYEQKMNVLFKKQPGLTRRFMWHMSCPGYNGEELGEIYALQLTKEGYIMEDPTKIKEYIAKNENYFPSYGGDTERLINYTLNKHSIDMLQNNGNDKIIKLDHVIDAMQDLKKNNLEKVADRSKNGNEADIMQLWNMLNRGRDEKVSCE